MGLNIIPGNHMWSYSGFHQFRTRLAAELNLVLDDMVGFGGQVAWPDDPIVPFLNHSDCDGQLTATECARVAPRLRELVSGWPASDLAKVAALRLADTMSRVAHEQLSLVFC